MKLSSSETLAVNYSGVMPCRSSGCYLCGYRMIRAGTLSMSNSLTKSSLASQSTQQKIIEFMTAGISVIIDFRTPLDSSQSATKRMQIILSVV